MSKRILFISITVVLLAALVSGATMAFFTDNDTAGQVTFASGTVEIQAGSSVTQEEEMGAGWKLVNIFPEAVVSYDQGTRPNGEPVRSQRSHPSTVLSLETGQSEANFFSLGYKMQRPYSIVPGNPEINEYWLGYGGEIVVRFSEPVSAFGNRLLLVTEDTWQAWPEEIADVYVSQDGTAWTYVMQASNLAGGVPQSCCEVVVPDSLGWFRYVKVVDRTNPYDTPSGTSLSTWWNQNNNDAFDLNCIMVQRWERQNWNPGNCDDVKYFVRNVGTKNIRVRASAEGQWQFNLEWLEANWDTLGLSEKYVDWQTFVDAVESGALGDPVKVEPCNENWVLLQDGYFYYTGAPIQYGQEVELCLKVCLDGDLATNEFQGGTYTLVVTFEALQSSNNAPSEVWGVDEEQLYGGNP